MEREEKELSFINYTMIAMQVVPLTGTDRGASVVCLRGDTREPGKILLPDPLDPGCIDESLYH